MIVKALNLFTYRIFDRLGLSITKSYKRKKCTLNPVQLLVSYMAAQFDREINIIQVGGYDGVHNDPLTSILDSDLPVRAWIFEPQPEPYAALEKRYRNSGNVTPVEAAISKTDGDAVLYRRRGGGGSPKASMDENHYRRFGRRQPQEGIRVRAASPLTAASYVKDRNLDLLQIDAEGVDLEILEAFVGDGIFPHVVNVEVRHFDKHHHERFERLIKLHGYSRLDWGNDSLLVKNSLLHEDKKSKAP